MNIKNWIVWPFVVILWIVLMLKTIAVGDFLTAVHDVFGFMLRLTSGAFYSAIFAGLSGILLYLLLVLWIAIYQKHVDQIDKNADEVNDIKSISDRFKLIAQYIDSMDANLHKLANAVERIQKDIEGHKPIKDVQKNKEIENAVESFKF